MDLELLAALLEGFVFYGIIYSLLLLPFSLLKRHYLRGLCKYGGTKEKPGRACVLWLFFGEDFELNRASKDSTEKNTPLLMPSKTKSPGFCLCPTAECSFCT